MGGNICKSFIGSRNGGRIYNSTLKRQIIQFFKQGKDINTFLQKTIQMASKYTKRCSILLVSFGENTNQKHSKILHIH